MTKEAIGYLVLCSRVGVDKFFAGAVSIPVGWIPGNLYDRLCLMFKKANIKKVLDEDDQGQKAGNEAMKIKNGTAKVEESMMDRLSNLQMWTLIEVEDWIKLNKQIGEKNKDNKPNPVQKSESGDNNNANIPPKVAANEVPRPVQQVVGIQEGKSLIQEQMMADFGIGRKEVVEFQAEGRQVAVKLKVGENTFVLDEKLLSECLIALDLQGGETNMTKDELAKLGLKLVPSLIQENTALKDQVGRLMNDLVKKEEEIKELRKDAFNANTRELLLGKEVEVLKEERAQRSGSEQPTMINKLSVKLEEMEKSMKESQVETKQFQEEMTSKVAVIKTNTDRSVDIMGSLKKDIQKEKIQVSCRVKVAQELEEAQKTITFFGSKASLQHVEEGQGEFRRDLESLKKRRLIMVEGTEKPGIENLIQLLKKAGEKRSTAFIMLNMAAETAKIFLDDEEYVQNSASKLKITAKKLADSAKENFERIVFVIPPHTPQSYGFIKKLSETLLEGDGTEVIDISKQQMTMANGVEGDQTWKMDDGRSLKQCCLFEDEVREGWNNFSTNVMLTEVASLMSGKTTKLTSCGECGLGHDRSSHCQKDGDHREEIKTEQTVGNKGQTGGGGGGSSTGGGGGGASNRGRYKELPEECLKCFRTHDSGKCYISEDVMCNFPECYRKGHLRTVHYPQKADTVDRLFAKYSSNFPIIHPESNRKRENHGDSNRETKRSRDDKDRSR